MPPVGHQVKVVGEAHDLGQTLQDVNAEAFAAVLHGYGTFHHQTEAMRWERTEKRHGEDALTWNRQQSQMLEERKMKNAHVTGGAGHRAAKEAMNYGQGRESGSILTV